MPRLPILWTLAALAALTCSCQGGAAPPPGPDAGPPPVDPAGDEPEPAGDGEPEPDDSDPDSVSSASLGEPFDLGEGARVLLSEELEVRFVEVVGDSRCPEDVDCIWEGNAEIEVELEERGEEAARVRLNTHPDSPTSAVYRGYAIELLELAPYPRTESDKSGDYRATLQVTASR